MNRRAYCLLLAPVTGVPGPVLMIVAAAVLKVARVIPERMEIGAYQIYRFMSTNLTFAILVGLGTLFVSRDKLVGAFSPAYFVICTSTVAAMVVSGFFVGAWLKMYPVESAIVTACHSGLGGAGMVVFATLMMKWFS